MNALRNVTHDLKLGYLLEREQLCKMHVKFGISAMEKHRNNCRAAVINTGVSQNKGNFPEYLLKKDSAPFT
jgi:hypothetical protein